MTCQEKTEIIQHPYDYLNILISIRKFFRYNLERVLQGGELVETCPRRGVEGKPRALRKFTAAIHKLLT